MEEIRSERVVFALIPGSIMLKERGEEGDNPKKGTKSVNRIFRFNAK
jgi:hypothetical protein